MSHSSMSPSLWTPSDSRFDLSRINSLYQKMQLTIKKLQSSQFYHTFLSQLHQPQVLDGLAQALDSKPELDMVIYGIGEIESFESPRLQLSLAVLLKQELGCIGTIEVFDPALSTTECAVIEAMGCTVLSVDEKARREAWKPTLFFMQHNCVWLYDNLLATNWRPSMLNRMVVIGTNFEIIQQFHAEMAMKEVLGHVLGVRKHVTEVKITVTTAENDGDRSFLKSFEGMCWHFFDLEPDADMSSCLVDLHYTPAL